jgi:hypothetical protein
VKEGLSINSSTPTKWNIIGRSGIMRLTKTSNGLHILNRMNESSRAEDMFCSWLIWDLIVIHLSTSLTKCQERWWCEHGVLEAMFSDFSVSICTIVCDIALGVISEIAWLQDRSRVPRTEREDHEKEMKPLTPWMKDFVVSTWHQASENQLWLFMRVQIRSGSLVSN